MLQAKTQAKTQTKTQKTGPFCAYFTEQNFTVESLGFHASENSGFQAAENLEFNTAESMKFQADKFAALYHLGFTQPADWFNPELVFLHHIAALLIRKLSRQSDLELSRETVQVDLTKEELDQIKREVPFAVGMEYIVDDWIVRLWNALFRVFQAEIRNYDGTVSGYLVEHNANLTAVGRVFFHLVENKEEEYPFAFMATYSTKPNKSKRAIHTPLKNALEEFAAEEKKLLSLISTVIKAAGKSDLISGLLESGELFSPLKLTAGEAYTILKELPLYEESGILCRVPDWWKTTSNSIQLTVTVGEKEPSKLGLDAILDFNPEIKIDGESITEQELLEFLNLAEGLVRYKGKWVEIDKNRIQALLHALDKFKQQDSSMSLGEAMRVELTTNRIFDLPAEEIELSITHGQWLRQLRETITIPGAIPRKQQVLLAPTFRATLRPYQQEGLQWLYQMGEFGFGACLADDMGLGKTVQIIALLEHYRVTKGGQGLLILPASLIGNWQKEIEKFAPELPYRILHSSSVRQGKDLPFQGEKDCFLTITTYGMALRLESLKDVVWDYLILDEAQAIKNPGAKQTKAVKQIPANLRVALTGTPIENRLGDLWSLFDFLNQGLLGTAKEFTNFSKGLSDDAAGYSRLRKTIQPFLLRRLKTDKKIISDLPDKIEINAYSSLSKKQAALYQQLIDQIKEQLAASEGMERKGLILSAIMKFKQICNHPDQYLGGEEYLASHSGKFEQLKEICETIREKRERVLVFTQFREMTEPISAYLKELFSKEGFVLHGGTPVKKRSELVEQFQGETYVPYMVLSIKAGGVGLNLTAANHVIHFDRWWNPAVENQATDRAFRIGQRKKVMVHKLITTGTIEEKIDEIIKEKKALSGDLLGSGGEQWITEYSNEELMKLFALGGDGK